MFSGIWTGTGLLRSVMLRYLLYRNKRGREGKPGNVLLCIKYYVSCSVPKFDLKLFVTHNTFKKPLVQWLFRNRSTVDQGQSSFSR